MLALGLTSGLGLVAKHRAGEAHRDAERERARLAALIVEGDSLRNAAEEAPGLLPFLIRGDAATGSVEFIELVTHASARALFHADQISSRVDTVADGVLLITASATGRGDDAAVLRFLSTLESAAPLASVRRVALRRTADDGLSTVEVEVAGLAVLNLTTSLAGAQGGSFGSLPPALQLVPDSVHQRWLRTAFDDQFFQASSAVESVEQSWDPPYSIEVPVLKGLVGGPPWVAIVSGIDGVDGAVLLGQGDTAAGVTAIEVSPTGASLTRGDQVWRLRLPGEDE